MISSSIRVFIGVFIFSLSSLTIAQSLDFGVEVQQNYNAVEKFEILDKYHPDNLALSVLDHNLDTSNFYFSKFNMENNFEIPLYFRVNFRKRWFLDMKMSHSSNTLTMEGVSNYNDQYYTDNYGSYDQFIMDANASGFMDADTMDYSNYINSAKDLNESEIRTVEEFQLLSLTANAGVRFLPHKSVKIFLGMGFTVKGKFRKHLYNHIDFSNNHIQDMRTVNSGLDWYASKSTYFNFMAGLELYRFRLTGFIQSGISYTFPTVTPFQEVVYDAPSTAFDVVRTYGFSLGANLFSLDVGRRVKRDDVSSDEIIISNIKRDRDKFDIGFRLDRRFFNDLVSNYELPDQKLTVLDVDTILYNDGGTFHEALNMEVIKLGRVKRIQWGGRISGFMDIYLTRRLGLRGTLGGSKLVYDIESTQLKATAIDQDTVGLQYLQGTNTPRLSYAVYRKQVNVVDINAELTYKVVDRDLFSLTAFAGFGITGFASSPLNKNGNPKGVNELEIYTKFDNWYSGLEDTLSFKTHQGDFEMNMAESPEALMAKVDEPGSEYSLDPAQRRAIFPTFRFGVDANIERYQVGFGFDMSVGEMDRFLFMNYSSFYMSVGYKLWRR
jgi:hypothetical protein